MLTSLLQLTFDVKFRSHVVPDEKRLRMLYEVSRRHHQEKLSKTRIANQIGASTTQVARLLKEAEVQGIVTVVIKPPYLEDLQDKLRSRFGCLKEVKVVAASGDRGFNLHMLGKTAADYFDETLQRISLEKKGDHTKIKVGLSGGNTLYEMVQALPRHERDIEIYPAAIIGRGPSIAEHIDPLVLISELWVKSGRRPGTAFHVTIPPFERGASMARILKENEELKKRLKVREVWLGMHDVEILFASVGAVVAPEQPYEERTLLKILNELNITQQTLVRDGIVGDISYALFDKDGNEKYPRHIRGDIFMTLGVRYLRKMSSEYPKKRVVLVAGKHKEQVVKAALRGQLCNVLVTDDVTAETLIYSS